MKVVLLLCVIFAIGATALVCDSYLAEAKKPTCPGNSCKTPKPTHTPVNTPTITNTPSATNTPAPTATPTTSTYTNCNADPTLDHHEQRFVLLLNEYRARANVPPVTVNEDLSRAAQWKADEQATVDYFSHDDLTLDPNRTWTQRIRDCGYTKNAWLAEVGGAIVGVDNPDPGAHALLVWQLSPGHNAILIDPKYKEVGVGYALRDIPGHYYYVWWAEFAGTP